MFSKKTGTPACIQASGHSCFWSSCCLAFLLFLAGSVKLIFLGSFLLLAIAFVFFLLRLNENTSLISSEACGYWLWYLCASIFSKNLLQTV
jgi:hypothetical protein